MSPRIRARRTYELLFDATAIQKLTEKSEITEDIREWEYGAYEGLLTAQIRARRKEQGLDTERPWNIWDDGCEGGESPTEVASRLDRVIAKIKKIQGPSMHGEKGVDVILIAHGHILRAFAKRWIGFTLGTKLPMMLGSSYFLTKLLFVPTGISEVGTVSRACKRFSSSCLSS